MAERNKGHIRRAAHNVTKPVSATCLQFRPAAAGFVKGVSRLGSALLAAAAAPPAYLARRAGRYRLRATMLMLVMAPEKS